MHLHTISRHARALTGPVLALIAPAALVAGGMALTMQNGSGLGQAYSAAAAAEDASTAYLNPAGMVYLDHSESLLSLTYISHSGGFTNDGSLTAGVMPTAGGNGGTVGSSRIVPTLHAAHPFSERMAIGLSITAPYGLATEYAPDWVGRYHAIKSELKTINVGPSFAWRLTDHMAIGGGLDWQMVDVTLSNAIDFGLIGFSNSVPGFTPGNADGAVGLKGDDSTVGFNFGVMFDVAESGRLGLTYRSKMDHRLDGTATFTDVPAPFAGMFPNQDVSAPLALPERISVSFYYDVTPTFAVTADWSWWKWSRFETLAVDFANAATPDLALPQNWDDAAIYSLGVRWTQNNALIWRAGVAYNETPVPSPEFRSARIPDADRLWVCFGASYRVTERVRVDAGFAHLFIDESSTMNDDLAGHVLVGDYDIAVNILSVQGTMSF